MSDSKGHYSPVNTSEDSQAQPPAYTPSTAPSSPFIHPQQAGMSAAASSGLYPQLDHNAGAPSAPYQPTYQHPKFSDPSKPPPHMPQYLQLQHQQQQAQQQPHASCMASPLILMKPPSRIEDLKAKPGVVVCQHCSYLVLTETTPENGMFFQRFLLAFCLPTRIWRHQKVSPPDCSHSFLCMFRFLHLSWHPWSAAGWSHVLWMLSAAALHHILQGYHALLS